MGSLRVLNRQVDKPVSLNTEVPQEVPEVHTAELLKIVPKPQYEEVQKQVQTVSIVAQEVQVDKHVILKKETPSEVLAVQKVELVEEVQVPYVEVVDKIVPKIETQCVE